MSPLILMFVELLGYKMLELKGVLRQECFDRVMQAVRHRWGLNTCLGRKSNGGRTSAYFAILRSNAFAQLSVFLP
jgi:hypothetical protein